MSVPVSPGWEPESIQAAGALATPGRGTVRRTGDTWGTRGLVLMRPVGVAGSGQGGDKKGPGMCSRIPAVRSGDQLRPRHPKSAAGAPLDGTASDWLLNIRPIVPPGASRCPSVRRKSDVAIRV